MPSIQIPAIGEAFLGSDPQVLKVARVTFGDSDWSGGNDVDLTTMADSDAAGSVLVSFGDTGIVITNLAFHLVEAFTTAFIMIGPDSDINSLIANSSAGDDAVDFTQTAGVWFDFAHNWNTGVMAAAGGFGLGTDFAMFSGEWPTDSTDTLNIGDLSAGTITAGHCEMYVYYLEAPLQ